jgi:hypothetical protein
MDLDLMHWYIILGGYSVKYNITCNFVIKKIKSEKYYFKLI